MKKKTTSADFLKYGIATDSFKEKIDLEKREYVRKDSTVVELHCCTQPLYIEPVEGLVLLRTALDPQGKTESFVMTMLLQ